MEEGAGGKGRRKMGKEEGKKRKEEERNRKGRKGKEKERRKGRKERREDRGKRGKKEEEEENRKEEQTGRDASARGQKGTLKCHTRSHLKVSERNFKSESMISQRNPAPTRPYLVQM